MNKLLSIILILIIYSCNDRQDCSSQGKLYYESMEYEKAITSLSKCLSIDSLNQIALTYRSSSYLELGRYKQAFADLNRSFKIDSTSPHLLNSLGVYYQEMDSIKLSEYYYRKAIFYDSTYALPYSNLGIMYRNTKQFDLSRYYHNKAISLWPNDARLYIRRATLYWKTKKIDSALIDIDTAIYKANTIYEKVTAYYLRGLIFEDIYKYEKSISDFTKSIEFNENYGPSYYRRARVYSRTKKYDLALKDYKSAKQMKVGGNVDKLIRELEKLIIKIKNGA